MNLPVIKYKEHICLHVHISEVFKYVLNVTFHYNLNEHLIRKGQKSVYSKSGQNYSSIGGKHAATCTLPASIIHGWHFLFVSMPHKIYILVYLELLQLYY